MVTTTAIRVCAPHDAIYGDVCAFARRGYEERYGITLELYPDAFVYALLQNRIVGCFGGYSGSIHRPLTTEWYVSGDDLTKCAKGPIDRFPRSKLFEIGTRVVNLPPGSETNNARISLAMSAALLTYLHNQGGLLALFTADRSVALIARQLRVSLARLGKPSLARRDAVYQEKWRTYFDVPRECFALDLEQASHGCHDMCELLTSEEFAFEQVLRTPTHRELPTAA